MEDKSIKKSKLTQQDVRNILELDEYREELVTEADELMARARQLRRKAADLSASKLADKFDIHRSTVYRVIRGDLWGNVL